MLYHTLQILAVGVIIIKMLDVVISFIIDMFETEDEEE